MAPNAADQLLLDSRLSRVQWQALQVWLDEVTDDLTPSAAHVVEQRFDKVRRRSELQDLVHVD